MKDQEESVSGDVSKEIVSQLVSSVMKTCHLFHLQVNLFSGKDLLAKDAGGNTLFHILLSLSLPLISLYSLFFLTEFLPLTKSF